MMMMMRCGGPWEEDAALALPTMGQLVLRTAQIPRNSNSIFTGLPIPYIVRLYANTKVRLSRLPLPALHDRAHSCPFGQPHRCPVHVIYISPVQGRRGWWPAVGATALVPPPGRRGFFDSGRFAWTRVLAVERFAVTSAIFNAFSLLFKLRKLEELIFADASLEVLFPWEVAPLALVNKDNSGNVVAAPLRRLTLVRCPELFNTWKGDGVTFSKHLETLQVSECAKLISLLPPSTTFQNLTSLEVSRCHRLRSLTIEDCGFLKVAVVPTDKSLLLSWLRKLEIRNCGAVVEVFEPLRADAAGDVELLSSLGTLHLRDLPMLRLIFPKGFHRTRSFMELHTIQVHNCSRLLNVLTPNMVKSLARLLKIEIKDCTMLEEIIAKEKEDEEILESIIR
ncbi:hypothetical protein CRG98_048050 [Punica granatum]|uniref:Disease resistance protein At4g27190-like leucine-rich repeats domain-containing protein n=1 Tax=Punica granatum TaxID=22663 RepID=A0A2I0HJR7_PUNGR|nr:hypothetical protein CRG98_048050 [Punica granatum]